MTHETTSVHTTPAPNPAAEMRVPPAAMPTSAAATTAAPPTSAPKSESRTQPRCRAQPSDRQGKSSRAYAQTHPTRAAGMKRTSDWMTQPQPVFGETVPDSARTAAALALSPAAVAGTGLPVQVVSCGVPFLFVPLTTRAAVDGAAVNASALDALLRETNTSAHGIFVFSAEPGEAPATVYSRMFAPELGVTEDPATGGASGPLGCYLVRHKVVQPDQSESMLSLQGVKMGRPSHIHIAIGLEKGHIASVRVGGEAVLAGEGTLYVS